MQNTQLPRLQQIFSGKIFVWKTGMTSQKESEAGWRSFTKDRKRPHHALPTDFAGHISNTLKTEIGCFFKNEEENEFIITDPNDRRVGISRSGPHGKTAYELELLAEGMKKKVVP